MAQRCCRTYTRPVIDKLGVWCDYVTEAEYRAELTEAARLADPGDVPAPGEAAVPCAFPGPGTPEQIRARIDEAVANFRRSINFTVWEFAETTDGQRLMLNERGFSSSMGGAGDHWAHMRLEEIADDARELFWLDEYDGAEDHCADLSGQLLAHGVRITAGELRRLPYEVQLSDRLRARAPQ